MTFPALNNVKHQMQFMMKVLIMLTLLFLPLASICFSSADEAKTFYRQYGIRKGFSMRIRSSKKGTNNELRYFILVCSRAGTYVSQIPAESRSLPTQANECPSRITLTKREDKWYITHVIEERSHDLSPTKTSLFRGNRMMNLRVKRCIDLNAEAGVRTNKRTYQSLVHAAGGYDNIAFVERDVKNYISQQRRALGKEGDDQALLKHFSRMRELNKDFFFDIDMDEDNRIRDVVWADARSRAASQYFGDVVSFDTIYLTNKYDMPFAPFVEVNHYGQSILLGCGLLLSKDTNTFVWLFECWLLFMYHKAPQGIVTYQCQAMKNAITIVFPQTRHRWCLWHIMKKISEKLQGYAQYKDMKRTMKVVVYES